MGNPDTAVDSAAPVAALSVDPIWRQAAIDACVAFRYGETIPHAWLFEHLQIVEPVGVVDAEHWRAHAWDVLRKVERFRDCMMEEHKRYLVNLRGEGYVVVEPGHQTGIAMGRLHRKLRKQVSDAMAALIHIDDTVLSLDEARENAEAKGKMGWFRTVALKQLDAPQAGQPCLPRTLRLSQPGDRAA